jgi:ATP-dependent Lhr-like helicase
MVRVAIVRRVSKATFNPLERWFSSQGWAPFDFQRDAWRAYIAGRDGLVHAPTGFGKTLAVFGGPMIEACHGRSSTPKSRTRSRTEPLRVVWITPMRALASDTAHSLTKAIEGVGLNWSIELRTGDTSSSIRRRQRHRLPSVLVTTPESLSVLISYPHARELLGGACAAVVDEWHELLSTKRGVQTELGLARLRALSPGLRTWGLSATLGNLDQAMRALVGPACDRATLISASNDKTILVDTLLPESIERFPWGGHMGLRMVPAVGKAIDAAKSTLIFTNTRAQAEIWFRALLEQRPELLGQLGIHHGSLDRKLRGKVESHLREGTLRAVVCTSSLDLGVDFTEVEQVIQIGSPKGVARLMQRSGRSGHQPGKPSRVICVPTHAFELVEFSAAREAIQIRDVEPRTPLDRPLDVLAQHLVSVACGGGFDEASMLGEVRATHAYASLGDDEWRWTLDFISRGGPSLTAYPRFLRVLHDETGRWTAVSDAVARMHRLAIGTITSDGVVMLVMNNGRKLGSIEESFVTRLRPGETFTFAGRVLELISLRDMTARVRPATRRRGSVPQWAGGRFPLSTLLADRVRRRLDEGRDGELRDAEMQMIAPILEVQKRWSVIPRPDQLLVELAKSRDGHHAFLYPFLGRLVHEGLGAMLAHRLCREIGAPVTATFTDYGIELLSTHPLDLDEPRWRRMLSADALLDDLLACLNSGELARRQFREIARIAGLIVPQMPGAPRSNRQLQASAELFFDVFSEFDPGNLLLHQARREVLERQLEVQRLEQSLRAIASHAVVIVACERFTPMAFPIWAQRIQSQTVRVEGKGERIDRVLARLEAEADKLAATSSPLRTDCSTP